MKDLFNELSPERSISHQPFFQVMFILQNAPTIPLRLEGLTLDILEVDKAAAKLDLTLSIQETDDGLAGAIEYNTDLFDKTTVARMAEQFQRVLEAISADQKQQISEIPLLSEQERDRMLVEWNDTEVVYPPGAFIHVMFEDQARRTPDAAAVVFEGGCLSYDQLNKRANQLASYLRAKGVGSEAIVGICLDRSLNMVVGLLGILKAGAAYMPLNPDHPNERLAFMLRDAQAPVLLTERRLAERIPDYNGEVICLDSDWPAIATHGQQNAPNEARSDSLAYVIYTSGSTGWPKGVMNTHGAIANRLLWMQEAYGLTEADRVLQKTPFSFDVSVWEFFWPLMTGARLVVAQPGGHQDAAYLVKLIAREKITVAHFVPSMLRVFLEQEGLEECGSLRKVISSGEALSIELQERFFARLRAQLDNLYGPTEAAVDVTRWTCGRDSKHHAVPIGTPIANTRLYILDPNSQPVPTGAPGELHIAGANLARGYVSRPDLTAERFIPDAFAAEPGGRLYRTGDLCRYLPDGNIVFLERIDNQVKVRGARIELGEIESVMSTHPQVREAVVVVRETDRGEKMLIGYAMSEGAEKVSASEIRDYLRERLPDYMVPAGFVMLDEMPLNSNGKIDRKALPRWEAASAAGDRYQGPRTYVEQELCEMWEEVLGVERVGISDNFFEIGGHSLMAAQVISRVRKVFGVEIPLRGLFEEPTIERLAMEIVKTQTETLDSEEVARILADLEVVSDAEV